MIRVLDVQVMDTCNGCGDFTQVERWNWTTKIDTFTTSICARCLADLKSKLCVGMVLPVAHARRTDPDTSKLAAASVNVTKGQERVLDVIRVCFPHDVFTLDALVDAAGDCFMESDVKWSPSGVRSRCSELVKQGKVLRLGTTTLPSGRSARLHRLATS